LDNGKESCVKNNTAFHPRPYGRGLPGEKVKISDCENQINDFFSFWDKLEFENMEKLKKKNGEDISEIIEDIKNSKSIIVPLFVFCFLSLLLFFTSKPSLAYSLGNTSAKIHVVEFSDYQCPYCARFENDDFPYIYRNFIKKGYVYWTFKDFPLTQIHKYAFRAAEYADCSGNQYMEARTILYQFQYYWSYNGHIAPILYKYLNDFSKIKSCVNNKLYDNMIKENMNEGEKLGVQAVPNFFIYVNDRFYKNVKGYRNLKYWYYLLVNAEEN
jgi:hypothetical protein